MQTRADLRLVQSKCPEPLYSHVWHSSFYTYEYILSDSSMQPSEQPVQVAAVLGQETKGADGLGKRYIV